MAEAIRGRASSLAAHAARMWLPMKQSRARGLLPAARGAHRVAELSDRFAAAAGRCLCVRVRDNDAAAAGLRAPPVVFGAQALRCPRRSTAHASRDAWRTGDETQHESHPHHPRRQPHPPAGAACFPKLQGGERTVRTTPPMPVPEKTPSPRSCATSIRHSTHPSDGEFGKAIRWSQYALFRLGGFRTPPFARGNPFTPAFDRPFRGVYAELDSRDKVETVMDSVVLAGRRSPIAGRPTAQESNKFQSEPARRPCGGVVPSSGDGASSFIPDRKN